MDRKTRQKFETPHYGYGAVESALAAVFGADVDIQGSALRARLKHFGRLGLPGGRGGKGTRMLYSLEHATQWLVALLLSDIGIDPTVIVKTIHENWDSHLTRWVQQATDAEALAGNAILFSVRPRSMSGAWLKKRSPSFRKLPWVYAYRSSGHHHHLKAVGITVPPPELGAPELKVHGADQPAGKTVSAKTAPPALGHAQREWICTCNLTEAVRELEAALAGK